MPRNRKWTEDTLRAEIANHSTLKSFREANAGGYAMLRKLKLFHLIEHFKEQKISRGKGTIYTKEVIAKEALKYDELKDFRENSRQHYKAAVRNNWLQEVTAHIKNRVYWTEERVRAVAEKHTVLKEFMTKDRPAYSASHKWGIYKEITAHMERGTRPTDTWEKSEVLERAAKFKRVTEFSNKDRRAWHAAKQNGWLEEATAHMIKPKKNTKKDIAEVAQNYTVLKDFRKENKYLYKKAKDNGWLAELTGHMESRFSKRERLEAANSEREVEVSRYSSWEQFLPVITKEEVLEASLKFDSISAFIDAHPEYYIEAEALGYLSEITDRMSL